MSRGQERKRRGIHHPEPSDPNDLRLAIDHRQRIGRLAHLVGSRDVIDRRDGLVDVGQDVRVARDAGTGEELLAVEDILHVGKDLAGAFEPRHGDLGVGLAGDPRGVDERRDGRVGRGDGDVAAGKGGLEADGHGCEVGPVQGRPAGDARGDQVFDFGPVGGECGEVFLRGGGEVGAQTGGDFFPA